MEKFKYCIDEDAGLLYIGDDCIPIDWIIGLGVKQSVVNNGSKYAIHLLTKDDMELELYYRQEDRTIVQDACDELKLAICEYKNNRDNKELN